MYEDDKKTSKQKVRMLIDTITISNNYEPIENIIIDALSEHGYEIDIVRKDVAGLPPRQELSIYKIRQ